MLHRPLVANSSMGMGLTTEKERTFSNISRNSGKDFDKNKTHISKKSIETQQIYNGNVVT